MLGPNGDCACAYHINRMQRILHRMAIESGCYDSRARLTACLVINLVSSISIVFTNKWIYVHYGFPNVSLTCIHFLTTFLGLQLCAFAGVFSPKKLRIMDVLPLSLTFCGFVVFTNLSLQHNTVGTYQLAKVMTTPCVMFIHLYFYGRSYSHRVKLTVVCQCCRYYYF